MSDHPKIFSKEYYQRLYDVEERHWWSQGMREIAARWLDRRLSGHRQPLLVLDAGCGTGVTLNWLERYAAKERMVGIDLAWFALEFCRARRLPRISQASIMALPFRSEIFDLVTCVDVIQHLPPDGSEQKALDEMRRVLKPGGYLYLRTNAQGWGRPSENHQHGEHYHRYSLDELVQKITDRRFLVEQVTHANSLGSLFAETKRRLWQRGRATPSTGADHGLAIQVPKSLALNSLLLRWMRLEAIYLARPGRRLPFGHSLLALAKKTA